MSGIEHNPNVEIADPDEVARLIARRKEYRRKYKQRGDAQIVRSATGYVALPIEVTTDPRLSDADFRVLYACAALERNISRGSLADLLRIPADTLDASIEHLDQTGYSDFLTHIIDDEEPAPPA
jgi:hypothetical protein